MLNRVVRILSGKYQGRIGKVMEDRPDFIVVAIGHYLIEMKRRDVTTQLIA